MIQRYDPSGRPYIKAMIKDELGMFIRYSEYEKLVTENHRLKLDLIEAKECEEIQSFNIPPISSKKYKMVEIKTNLQSQNKELIKINALIQSQIQEGKLIFFMQRDKDKYLKLINELKK